MSEPRFFAIVPAAGSGSRMGASIPKQYLQLAGKAILAHSVDALLAHPAINQLALVVSGSDEWIDQIFPQPPEKLKIFRCGGATRAESVANGLAALCASLSQPIRANDWALVHDAARPGLTGKLIDQMITALANDPVGGLLALPVVDTVKRSFNPNSSSTQLATVSQTIPRQDLWLAQTPQMFRYALLQQALQQAAAEPEHAASITDEASAMEAMGYEVKLVPGHLCNLKVTMETDLAIAEMYLRAAIHNNTANPF